MITKHKLNLFLIILILIIFSSNVFSIGLGISPGKLNYNNVLKGGYAQQTLVVSSFVSQNLSINFETGGAIKDWIIIDENISNITLGPNAPVQLKIKLYPPIDTANGDYTGFIRVITDKIIDPETGVGSSVLAAFQVNIDVKVVGDQIIACSGGGLTTSDVEVNYPLIVSASILNEGNVRLNPQMFLEIYNKYQTEVMYSSSSQTQSTLPTESSNALVSFNINLPEDQYWARIKIPECNLDNTVTFNVLEKGGISDKGELIRVETKPWAKESEIIPITAIFRNDGGRTVSAKFKGEVLYNNQVVKIIDTDSLDAKPGEVISLQSFFKPDTTGQYFIRGKVYFNNKLTGEKASVLNVNTKDAENLKVSNFLFYMAIIILIAIIIIMLILIERKKKRR